MLHLNKRVGIILFPFIIEMALNIHSFSSKAIYYYIVRFIIQIIMIVLCAIWVIIESIAFSTNKIAKAIQKILIIISIALVADLIFEVISLTLFIFYSELICPLSKLGYGIHFISLSYLFVLISEINEKNN